MKFTDKNLKGERMIKRAENVSTLWMFGSESLNIDEGRNKDKLVLFDNVQFIYELALAQLELYALDVDFEVKNGLREFKLLCSSNIDNVIKRTAYFKIVGGRYTDYFYITRKNFTRSVNQYLTHWIYPYKGKFHPQMIRALLNIIGLKENDTVLDPFVGSGTTAVEAMLLGINCIGIDVSPLCVLQSRVKTESLEVIEEIENIKEFVKRKISYKFFDPEDKSLLDIIESINNDKVRDFYKLAYLVAVSDKARRGRKFEQSFVKNLDLMIKSVKSFVDVTKELNLKLGKVEIKKGDSRNLPLEDNSIDGIITSPPYSIALDYVSNDSHALKVLGCNLSEIREYFIGVRGRGSERIDLYNEDMKKSYKEMYRVLKPGKFAVIVIGNATYMGEEIKTVEFTIDYCQKIGFKLINNIDKIIFGLYNVMQKENILIFQKV
jgi:DNA modification methylase